MEDSFTIVEGRAATPEVPVFVLSFRHRDEVAAAAAGGGWRVVAARRPEGLEQRFLASGASVAVIDARGALSDGLQAARALGRTVEAQGGALLMLMAQSDTVHMRHFYDAGATHFLSSPMSSAAMAHAIRFAQRHVERLAGGTAVIAGAADPIGWNYDPETRSIELTPALARLLELGETPGVRPVLARIAPADRGLLRMALGRLDAINSTTAFAHDVAGVGRVVQHLQRDSATGRIHGLVEVLGVAPDAARAVRDALTGARDGASARRWLDQRLADGAAVGLVLVGLTRFETINTAYGRAVGDELLRAVSRRVAEVARATLGHDVIVARIGGSEFVVAAELADVGGEARLAEAISTWG